MQISLSPDGKYGFLSAGFVTTNTEISKLIVVNLAKKTVRRPSASTQLGLASWACHICCVQGAPDPCSFVPLRNSCRVSSIRTRTDRPNLFNRMDALRCDCSKLLVAIRCQRAAVAMRS